MRRRLDLALRVFAFHPPHADVFPRGHLVAHEVLKDDPDFVVQIFQLVIAQVNAIEQNLPFGRVVEPGDQLDHGRLALAVFSDQRDPLARRESEVEVAQHPPRRCRDRQS